MKDMRSDCSNIFPHNSLETHLRKILQTLILMSSTYNPECTLSRSDHVGLRNNENRNDLIKHSRRVKDHSIISANAQLSASDPTFSYEANQSRWEFRCHKWNAFAARYRSISWNQKRPLAPMTKKVATVLKCISLEKLWTLPAADILAAAPTNCTANKSNFGNTTDCICRSLVSQLTSSSFCRCRRSTSYRVSYPERITRAGA